MVQVTGVIALVALALVVGSGESLAGRLAPARLRGRLFRLHRSAAVGAILLAGFHGLVAIASLHPRSWDVGRPFEPVGDGGAWILLGLAALASIGIAASSWLARRTAAPTWARRVALGRWTAPHRIGYLAIALAAAHGYLSHQSGMRDAELVAYAVGLGMLLALLVFRVVSRPTRTAAAP